MMEKKLLVTASPHIRAKTDSQSIMRDVIIALLPTLLASIYYFGLRALLLCVVCVAASVLCEFLYQKWMGLPIRIGDLSAALTGLLLALNLPATFPVWMAVVGCFVAIVVVKQLFGGLGKNFANPAIVGRIVLTLSFASHMAGAPSRVMDAVSGATPLAAAAAGEALPSYLDLFLGRVGGVMGETCKWALLLGAAYLLLRRVISITTPLAFMGSVFLLSIPLGMDPVYQILSGGLILGAFFMATDYVTSPNTPKGEIIYGIGIGLLVCLIRYFGGYPEGVCYSILIMNI